MRRPKPAEPWGRPTKWDVRLQFVSDAEFAGAEARGFLPRSAPSGVPTRREKPGKGRKEPHLAVGRRAGSLSPRHPGAQGESATTSWGQRTKQVGGPGLAKHAALPALCRFCGFGRPQSQPESHAPRPASSKAALQSLEIGEGAASDLTP